MPLSTVSDSLFDLGLDPHPSPNVIDPVDLLLSGMMASATFDGSADMLHVKGVGLGDQTSFVKQGQDMLFSLDLNPANQRQLDLDVSLAADDSTELAVSPVFDLDLELALSHIAGRITNLPAYALDDTLRLVLGAAAHPAVRIGDGAGTHGLAVVAGQLALASRTSPQNDVTVAAGRCLLDRASSGRNGPWSTLSAGACP